ncbi:MAG: hypothetical protein WC654_01025 [Patescibacteria group bacterium]
MQADPDKAVDPRDIKAAIFAITALEKQLVLLREVADPATRMKLTNQELFSILTTIPGTEDDLRQIILTLSMYLNPVFKQRRFGDELEAPTEQDVNQVIEFVDHITNQETFRHYFSDQDPKAKKKFDSLLSVSILQQEAARLRSHRSVSKNTKSFVFIPSRDLKTELSGHMADACWAEKEDSILQKHPNFISMTFVENPGHEIHERVAGACLLIETKAEDGTKLIVIRGLNPIENVATTVDVADFFNKLTVYLKPIVQARGCRLAVVVDGHRGGSASNRESVYSFLSQSAQHWQNVPLASKEDTEYNGYDITNVTYLVP